jgi:hypothetical protein
LDNLHPITFRYHCTYCSFWSFCEIYCEKKFKFFLLLPIGCLKKFLILQGLYLMADISIGFSSSYSDYGMYPTGSTRARVEKDEAEQPKPPTLKVAGQDIGDDGVPVEKNIQTEEEKKTSGETGEENGDESKKSLGGKELTADDLQVINELKRRDMEVRAHEAAHIAAGGRYITSGASFSYQSGPDGKRYANGGEVGIDSSPVSGDPAATIMKMQAVRGAALAPANPSAADVGIAARAGQTAAQARVELAKENTEKLKGDDKEPVAEEQAESEDVDNAQGGETTTENALNTKSSTDEAKPAEAEKSTHTDDVDRKQHAGKTAYGMDGATSIGVIGGNKAGQGAGSFELLA